MTSIPDVVRAQIFLADFLRMEREGTLPNLIMIQLPSDHTNGAQPGVSTAKAMVADNDLAMGQIIEALTQSKFWPKTAIFVVQDDAQNGVDHVDGHRTVALVVSPYARRGHVDSTFYSTQSMVKTIALMLGCQPCRSSNWLRKIWERASPGRLTSHRISLRIRSSRCLRRIHL